MTITRYVCCVSVIIIHMYISIKDEDGFRDGDYYDDGDGDWSGPRELIKPEDQIELSEKELKEEFTRVLTADNPHAPANIVRYNFRDKHFKQVSGCGVRGFNVPTLSVAPGDMEL